MCYNIFVSYAFFISSEICSTLKLPKQVTLLQLTYKANQRVPIDTYSSRLITYITSFIILYPLLNLGSFWKYFCISKFVKRWRGIKNPGLL